MLDLCDNTDSIYCCSELNVCFGVIESKSVLMLALELLSEPFYRERQRKEGWLKYINVHNRTLYPSLRGDVD